MTCAQATCPRRSTFPSKLHQEGIRAGHVLALHDGDTVTALARVLALDSAGSLHWRRLPMLEAPELSATPELREVTSTEAQQFKLGIDAVLRDVPASSRSDLCIDGRSRQELHADRPCVEHHSLRAARDREDAQRSSTRPRAHRRPQCVEGLALGRERRVGSAPSRWADRVLHLSPSLCLRGVRRGPACEDGGRRSSLRGRARHLQAACADGGGRGALGR
jgi:hypothetical protein